MGHVPSRELCAKPFAADMETGAAGSGKYDRLVAVALTKYQFPSPQDPLFLKFCDVRNELHVRNWHWRPTGISLDTLPPSPTPAELYRYYVEDPTAVVDHFSASISTSPPASTTTTTATSTVCSAGGSVEQLETSSSALSSATTADSGATATTSSTPTQAATHPPNIVPIPVLVVKMNAGINAQEYPTADNCTVVGCIGSRHFHVERESDERTGPAVVHINKRDGTALLFLTQSYYNEVKTLPFIRLACACYSHFSSALSRTSSVGKSCSVPTPWPEGLFIECCRANVPIFSLVLQLNKFLFDLDHGSSSGASGRYWCDEDFTCVERFGRVQLGLEGDSLVAAANGFSQSVPEVALQGPPPPSHLKRLVCRHRIPAQAAALKTGDNHGNSPNRPGVSEEHFKQSMAHLELILERAKLLWKFCNRAVTNQVRINKQQPIPTKQLEAPAEPQGEEPVPKSEVDQLILELRPTTSLCVASLLTFDAKAETHKRLGFPPSLHGGHSHSSKTVDSSTGSSSRSGLRSSQCLDFPSHTPLVPTSTHGDSGSCGPVPPVASAVYLGDMTPVTIYSANGGGWLHKLWHMPLHPLHKSLDWQPHLADGFVCYKVVDTVMMVYHEDASSSTLSPVVYDDCAEFVFLKAGEVIFTLSESGEYLQAEAA